MYVPSSNIKTTGYTNGGEYILRSNNQQYVGPYFIDVDNNVYTGNTYSDSSISLVKINSNIPSNLKNVIDYTYTSLQPKTFPALSITPDYIRPTEKDYGKGYFVRFILKPVISSQINDFIEVNFNKYDQVAQDPDLQVLYQFVNVVWKLTGPWYDIYDKNIRLRAGIIDTNKRSIAEAEKILPNVSLYFTDLKQFGSSI